MVKTKLKLAMVAAVLALASAAPAHAATILYSDYFESPNDSLGSTSPFGWTVSGQGAKIVNNSTVGTFGGLPNSRTAAPPLTALPGDPSDTTQYMGLKGSSGTNPDTTVVQSSAIDTQGYNTVQISFDYSAYRSEAPDKLSLYENKGDGNGLVLLQTLDMGPADSGQGHDAGLPWTHLSTILTGIVGSLVLEFTVGTSEDEYAYLDNIVITAVPLPASLALAGTGLAALGLFGWLGKRKRNQASALA